jgi:AcrR family transcriptional regulator
VTMRRMASASSSTPPVSLRERKKIKTRQTIRDAAYRLFAEQGYDETTVEQIAAAAEVSPSTFFRYFPVKEDVVLSDEYDPLIAAAIAARPADESIVDSMRVATGLLVRQMYESEHAEVLQRMRLVRDVPAIRARMGENIGAESELLVGALAQRSGRPPDLRMRVVVGALFGGWHAALMHWVETGGVEPLPELLERSLTMMSEGLAPDA